jgi:hypothetical protein
MDLIPDYTLMNRLEAASHATTPGSLYRIRRS